LTSSSISSRKLLNNPFLDLVEAEDEEEEQEGETEEPAQAELKMSEPVRSTGEEILLDGSTPPEGAARNTKSVNTSSR